MTARTQRPRQQRGSLGRPDPASPAPAAPPPDARLPSRRRQPQRPEPPRADQGSQPSPVCRQPPESCPRPGQTSLRRAGPEARRRTTGGRLARVSNILEGRVVSSDTRQAEEGVRIIVSNRLGKFENRVATTDAYGRYAVRLPDGDWTVKVDMPSGRVYPVSQITISGGQIVDNFGRDIPSLTITR